MSDNERSNPLDLHPRSITPVETDEVSQVPVPPEIQTPKTTEAKTQPPSQQPQPPIKEATVTFKIPPEHTSHPLHTQQTKTPHQTNVHVSNSDQACIDYLNSISRSPGTYSDYQVIVARTGPVDWEGERLKTGIIEVFPVIPFLSIKESIEGNYGGGRYSLQIKNDKDQECHKMSFSVPPQLVPPRVKCLGADNRPYFREAGIMNLRREGENNMFQAYGTTPDISNQGFGAFTRNARGESKAVDILRKIEETKAETEYIKEQARLEEERERIALEKVKREEKNNPRYRDDDARRETKEMVEKLAEQQAQDRKEFQQLMMQMMSSFKDMFIPLLTNNNKNDGSSELIASVLKSNQEGLRATVDMMANMSQRSREEQSTVAASMAAANQKIIEMAVANASASAEKAERMLQAFFEKKLEGGDDKLETFLKAMKYGESRQKELYETIQAFNAPQDDFNYDPNAGFFGNIAGLAFNWLKGLSRSGEGASILEQVGQVLNRRPGALTEKDLLQAATKPDVQRLYAAEQQKALPQPTQQNAIPMPFTMEVTQQSAQALNPPPKEEPKSMIEAFVVTQDPGPAAPAPLVVSAALKEYVTEMINMACEDVIGERRSPDWPEFGLDKLDRPLLNELIKLSTPAEQLKLISKYCDRATYQRLLSVIGDSNQPQKYACFLAGLNQLIEGAKNANANGQ